MLLGRETPTSDVITVKRGAVPLAANLRLILDALIK